MTDLPEKGCFAFDANGPCCISTKGDPRGGIVGRWLSTATVADHPPAPSSDRAPQSRDKRDEGENRPGRTGFSMIKPRTQSERSVVVVVFVAVADGDHSGHGHVHDHDPLRLSRD
jgi:hypothetical protein